MSGRQFKILEEIAEGGFGKVYKAQLISADRQFTRVVVLKLLHEKWATHTEVLSRTRDEARLLGLLHNDHIVKVEDLTSINGQCAIVMEYLDGVDLKWLIKFLKDRDEAFPYRAFCEIFQASADALAGAWQGVPPHGGEPLRVIHRDIKPSNILVTTTGRVKVLDFGTARANFAKREAHTQELQFGSQGYMSPERVLLEEDTPAADVFSLGITMYEVLALEPFGKIHPRPTNYATHLEERLAALPLHGAPAIVDGIRDLVRQMLAYKADERPAAADLVDELERLGGLADDMPLSRFGRDVVTEARKAMPAVKSDDPLTGSVVEEDHSAGEPVGGETSDELVAPPTPEPAPLSPPSPPSLPPTTELPRPTPLVLALGLGGVLAVVVGLLLVIGIAGYVIVTALRSTGPVLVVDDPGASGGPAVRTTLQADPSAAFEARLSGDRGFSGRWTGPRAVTHDLPAGTYQTFVSRAGASPIRGQTFVLEGTECRVTLDLTEERWRTECN